LPKIETRGPITNQNIAFAADSFIRQLPEPYITYLSLNFIKTTAVKEDFF